MHARNTATKFNVGRLLWNSAAEERTSRLTVQQRRLSLLLSADDVSATVMQPIDDVSPLLKKLDNASGVHLSLRQNTSAIDP
jgi:hypothetical protein